MKKPKIGTTQGVIFGLGIATSYGLLSGDLFLSLGIGLVVGLIIGLLFPEDIKK